MKEKAWIKQNLEALDKVLSASPDHIGIMDIDGRNLYVNKPAAEVLGLKQSDIVGKTWREMGLPSDIVEFLETNLRSVFSMGETVTAQASGLTAHGIRVYEYSLTPIKEEDGTVSLVVGTTRDITEHKRTEETLKAERDVLDTIMENTEAHLAYLDAQLNFVLVNSTYAKGSGHAEEELIGRNHFELFPNPENEVIFKRVRDTGEAIEFKAKPFEFVDQPWRGVTYWDWTLIPVKNDFGQVIGLVLSLIDVTKSIRPKKLSDALNEINASISSTLNFNEIMQKVVNEATKAINTEAGAILLGEDNRWAVKYVYGFPEEMIGMILTGDEPKHAVLASKTRQPVAIDDAYNDERANRTVMEKFGIRSVLTIPLIARENVIGSLSFCYHSAQVAFNEDQIDFATKLGASVSLALENSRLYESQRRIADTLQEALLVVPKHIPGVDYGYLYRSATEEARVGGDFYDLFEIEHDKVGIVVGDVAGHGIEAAALTSAVKNTIKAHAVEDSTPAIIMAKTNDLLAKTSPPASFVTVFFAILELETGNLTYCSAGHPPAIVKRGSGAVDLLAKNSPIVGAFKGLHYRSGKAKLNENDILIIYTDGITEARHDGDFYGEQRLVNFIENLKPTSTRDIPQAILNNVMEHTGGKLNDDVALLTTSLEK